MKASLLQTGFPMKIKEM